MSIWDSLDRPACYPDCNCEFMLPDCLICQPYSFWSSFVYLICAYFIFKNYKNYFSQMKIWVLGLIIITFTSLFAHASFSVISLALDLGSISTLMILIHLPENTIQSNLRFLGMTLGGILITTLLLLLLPQKIWVGVVFIFFLFSAGILWRVHGPVHRDLEFWGIMALYGASFLLFHFDKHPAICFKSLPVFGHTLWHLGSASTAYLFARWHLGKKKGHLYKKDGP
jgi:hypothetical protein